MKNMGMKELKIGNLTAKVPIIQGGMGVGISLSGLASAVANEGGIGVISSVGLGLVHPVRGMSYRQANIEGLKYEIRRARSKTDGILGVNILVAVSDFEELVMTAIDEKADILFLGAGMPLKIPAMLEERNLAKIHTKVAVIVSSARAANLIMKTWSRKSGRLPDMLVVEGPKAGGHLGFRKDTLNNMGNSLEIILPQVIEVAEIYEEKYGIEIPVIAAGGVFTGGDIYRLMDMGAAGVQMGTRFAATYECDAHSNFKQAIVESRKEDIVIIDSPVGLPGRAIESSFLREIRSGKSTVHCPWKCLKTCDYRQAPYCIAQALTSAMKGDIGKGFAFAGENAYRVNGLMHVHSLIEQLRYEYETEALKDERDSMQFTAD